MAITKPPTKVRRTLLEDIATLAPRDVAIDQVASTVARDRLYKEEARSQR